MHTAFKLIWMKFEKHAIESHTINFSFNYFNYPINTLKLKNIDTIYMLQSLLAQNWSNVEKAYIGKAGLKIFNTSLNQMNMRKYRVHAKKLTKSLSMLCRWCVFVHDDDIKWKHFPRYWPFVRGIHRSPVNSPHKGQWRGALMFTLICAK